MARKQADDSNSDARLASVMALLSHGYTENVRAYTTRIESNPAAVVGFGRMFELLKARGQFNWKGTESQQAAVARTLESAQELQHFLEGFPRPYQTYVIVLNHGNEITVETGWQEGTAGQVVWDRWTAAPDDPVMVYADMGVRFDKRDYRCEAKPAEQSPPPLYRYHPERFKAYRDYAEPVAKRYRQRADPATGMFTLDELNEMAAQVTAEMNRRSLRFPRKLKDDHPSPTLVLEAEHILATAYGRFVQAGRQIMDFPPALTEMLAETDIDDIPLNSIKLPYASQYLYFGSQAALEIEPGWLVDGAYVEQRGEIGDVRFTVTAVPREQILSAQWYLFPEVEYTQDFFGEFRSMDLATAIDTVLSDRLADLKKRRGGTGWDLTALLEEAAGENGMALPAGLSVVDVSPTLAGIRDDATRRRHPVYKAALQLVVNALCYVAAYPEDIDTVWPEGTPDSLKQKVLHGKGKEQMRAKSKLTALGYVPVHICGRRIAEQRTDHGIPAHGQGHVATHWRRGHWRNQVHGPARSLRKLIWVMPVVVGSKHGDDPEMGHVYRVS